MTGHTHPAPAGAAFRSATATRLVSSRPGHVEKSQQALICRVGVHRCALPLEQVAETMRCLPVEPIGEAPPYVSGIAIIRAAAVPVVDLAVLLGIAGEPPSRLVTVWTDRAAGRMVALAVSAVDAVTTIDRELMAGLPALLRETRPGVITAVGVLDAQVLLTLEGLHIVPDDVWATLARLRGAPEDAAR